MKMLIVILKDSHADPVIQAMTAADFRITRVASTSGLLHRGVVTLFLGIDDERVEEAVEIVRTVTPNNEGSEENRATIFVAPVKNFVQI